MAEIQSNDLITCFSRFCDAGLRLAVRSIDAQAAPTVCAGRTDRRNYHRTDRLGRYCPSIYIALFPANPSIAQERDILLKVGMLFFLFSAGLEINLTQIQQRKWKIVYN